MPIDELTTRNMPLVGLTIALLPHGRSRHRRVALLAMDYDYVFRNLTSQPSL